MSGNLKNNSSTNLQIRRDVYKAIDKGIGYLTLQQSSNGCWFDPAGSPSVGMTALAVIALHKFNLINTEDGNRANKGSFNGNIDRAVLFLLKYVDKDGLLSQPNQFYSGYEVPLVLKVLLEVDNRKYKKEIEILKRQILLTQLTENYKWQGAERMDRTNWRYGSWNYNESPQIDPDISVHIFNLDSLRLVGTDDVKGAIERASVFLRRCQNLKSENDLQNSLNDGGFKHAPFLGKAGTVDLDNGEVGILSYGSVTCDGLLGLIYVGAGRDYKPFQAGIEWLKENYALDRNPGMGKDTKDEKQLKEERNVCLFYYYRSLAKLFDALNEDTFVDKKGTKHSWANELAERIIYLQRQDGSWCNSSTTMWEGYPPLATVFNLDSLQTLRKWLR